MITRLFLKVMIYLTIGVFSINYLIQSRVQIIDFLHPTISATLGAIDLDEESMIDSHHLLE